VNESISDKERNTLEHMALAVVRLACQEYLGLKGLGVVKDGEVAISRWPKMIHRYKSGGKNYYPLRPKRIGTCESITDAQEVIDFFSDQLFECALDILKSPITPSQFFERLKRGEIDLRQLNYGSRAEAMA